MELNVLISSAGRRVALRRAFEAALLECPGVSGDVITADASLQSAAAWDATRRLLSPRCSDVDFVPYLLDCCESLNISLIIPTIDTELEVLADSRHRFASIGTTVLVPSPEVVAISADKRRTHEFLSGHSIPAPRQLLGDDLGDCLEDLTFPMIAKPRRGSASIGVRIIHSLDEAKHLPIGYVLEVLAKGDEYTADVFVGSNGGCDVIVPRQRLETRAGEVSKGVTRCVEPFVSAVRKVCRALPGAEGVLTVQGFFDPATGDVSIIEINPRFGGGFPLSLEAGANFPLWLIQRLAGLPVTARQDCWKPDLAMLRFDDAVFVPAADLAI